MPPQMLLLPQHLLSLETRTDFFGTFLAATRRFLSLCKIRTE